MAQPACRVLLTGANGFIGRNLLLHLDAVDGFSVTPFGRTDDPARLPELISQSDVVVHLAGANRPDDDREFDSVNHGLTARICDALAKHQQLSGRALPVLFSSSIQAELDNPYGRSKLAAEQALQKLSATSGNPVAIFRLPGVFGKWSRPNYNSVVATFCHNIARNLPIRIDDPETMLQLVYVDDVIAALLDHIRAPRPDVQWPEVQPVHDITLGDLAEQIRAFEQVRTTLLTERVGTGLVHALYATYVSHLPAERFSYAVLAYRDQRGEFVEMLKTPDCGQFSFLTAPPGITRGGHYHHSKTEKFLVIRGEARFRFRHMITHEEIELRTSGDEPEIVETIPGWAHDITNIGDSELIVMLWANEIFDRDRPDTISSPLS